MKISLLAAVCLATSVAGAQQPTPSPPPTRPDTTAPPRPIAPVPTPEAAGPRVIAPASATPLVQPAGGGEVRDPASPAAPAGGPGEFPVDRVVAIVGDHPILWSDVQEVLYQRR